jgi:hypothetical protein
VATTSEAPVETATVRSTTTAPVGTTLNADASRPGAWSEVPLFTPTGPSVIRVYETNALPSVEIRELPQEWKKQPGLLPPALWDYKHS